MFIFIFPLILVALLLIPTILVIKGRNNPKTAKRAIIINLCSFFAVLALAVILPIGKYVDAAETETGEETSTVDSVGLGYLSAALATGLGSIGCGVAVAGAAPAAIGATAEEPKSFGKCLIFVALGEGVALYGFLISFLIINKL